MNLFSPSQSSQIYSILEVQKYQLSWYELECGIKVLLPYTCLLIINLNILEIHAYIKICQSVGLHTPTSNIAVSSQDDTCDTSDICPNMNACLTRP